MSSSSRYAPLLPTTAQDAEREMEEAFESDNDDDAHSIHESTPLTNASSNDDNSDLGNIASAGHRRVASNTIPGAYDFEREYEYDYPPPGSPPRPSARALPNDIGNSNGILPSSPVRPSVAQPSFFRRIAGAVLPTHYVRVPTEAGSSHAVGGGTENDGVFANVMAKPQRTRIVQTENGDVHMVPEEIQKEAPPSYIEAQADAVPPYWETTVHAPAGIDSGADMIIEDLPTGSFLIFCLNAFISFFFQFVGFLLTYLLHTSHAAKYGSRAGLGLTLIQFGFYSRSMNNDAPTDVSTGPADPTASGGMAHSIYNMTATPSVTPTPDDAILSVSSKDWLSFFFMTLGWFLVLSSLIGFWRVKRWESALRAPATPPTPEELERDRAIRRNIESVFGIAFGEDDENARDTSSSEAAEARLTRDLRAAGLL
ncbi:Metal homeostatis protein BSD2 [Leucoagaricus sp. SymC.cos]|nr:Metal homeostatis protein BSD2 [Leucoagaricus sp. SymC.cos]